MRVADLGRDLSKGDLVAMLELIGAAQDAGTPDRFRHLMRDAARLIPIEQAHVSVADVDEQGMVLRTHHPISMDFPSAWLQAYRELGYLQQDPVTHQLLASRHPLIWSQLRRSFRTLPHRRFYTLAAEFGLRDGFSFGRRFARSTSASFFSCAGKELTRHRRHLIVIHSLLPHLHAALCEVYRGMPQDKPGLSPRERQVLTGIKAGKTNGDIGVQLGITERAVKYHVGNALQKLHAINRSQAVAIALSRGLIE